MKNKWIIWVAVAVVVIAGVFLLTRPASDPGAGDTAGQQSGKGLVNVASADVQELVDSGEARIVDVRTPSEFDAGHLKGAENVPVDQVGSAAANWDRDQALLVYCATGARSSGAVSQLQSMGFKTIYHFAQGLVAWQGDLDTGASEPVAQAEPVKTTGTPVMYEFYTDW